MTTSNNRVQFNLKKNYAFAQNLHESSSVKNLALTGQISNFFLGDLQEIAKVANYFKI